MVCLEWWIFELHAHLLEAMPKDMAQCIQAAKKVPTIILEAVADFILFLWHSMFTAAMIYFFLHSFIYLSLFLFLFFI